MKNEHFKFSSISQYRHVRNDVLKRNELFGEPTKIKFKATQKLHGTNSSVVYDIDADKMYSQSRNRVLSVKNDNAGFAQYFEDNRQLFKNIFDYIISRLNDNKISVGKHIVIYGEWAGTGVQKKVAVSRVPKFFTVFDVFLLWKTKSKNNEGEIEDVTNKISLMGIFDEIYSLDLHPNYAEFIKNFLKLSKETEDLYADCKLARIFNINTFPIYEFEIDFTKEYDESGIKEVDELVAKIDKECPVGKIFKVEGPGEGLVLKSDNNIKDYIFKVKGKSHKIVKEQKSQDPEVIAMTKAIKGFVEYSVTENRLFQGIEYLKEMGYDVGEKSTGHFIKWIVTDVRKEEGDIIEEHDFDKKLLNKQITEVARLWFFDKLNKGEL